MRLPLAAILLSLAGWAFLASGVLSREGGDARAAAEPATAPALATQLRYLGRDPSTGMPVRVGDRFIADQAEARARYGKDEHEPIAPSPAGPVDLAGLAIPALGVTAEVRRYGLDAFGRLDVPQDGVTVGWHPDYSSLPGRGGSTFLAAHYDYGGRPGVFHELSALAPGSMITVRLSDGAEATYRVTSTVDYDLGSIDMGALLAGIEGQESLALMTCSGPFVDGNYELRTVVLAVRQGS